MSIQYQLDKLWNQMQVLSYEIKTEALYCKGKTASKRYTNLSKDMDKLKAEYDKVRKLSINMNDPKQAEAFSKSYVEGRLSGKLGPDSHITGDHF